MSPPKIPVEKVDAAYLRRNLFYNTHTGELFWKILYGRRDGTRPAGTPDKVGYLMIRIFGKTYKTHRVIWCIQTGRWPSKNIDHINGRKADNRWVNLRQATTQQNGRNRGRQTNNRSGYKNVSKATGVNRWYVRIGVGRKTHYFGSYASPKIAAEVAIRASQKIFGKFAQQEK